MMLAALQFELHLRENQVAPVRAKLEKNIKVTSNQIYIESVVQQYRPQLKSEEFKDILDGPQLDLWESSQAYYRRYLQ